MKKMAAILLSIALAVSNVGAVPVLAVETNAQEAETLKDSGEIVGEQNEPGVIAEDQDEPGSITDKQEEMDQQDELSGYEMDEGTTDGEISETEYVAEGASVFDEETISPEEEDEPVWQSGEKGEEEESNAIEEAAESSEESINNNNSDIEEIEETTAAETSNTKYDLSKLGTVWFGSYYQDKIVDETELNVIRNFAEFKDGVAVVSDVRVARKGNSYNYEYFKESPIEWIIIGDDGLTYTLLSKKILDIREFGKDVTSEKDFWHDCTLRSWLNSSFYETAFSEEEKSCIWDTYVTNEVQTYDDWVNRKDGSTIITNDKVYLLYSDEVDTDSADSLVAYATPYAKTAETAVDWWLRGISKWNYGNIQNSYVSSNGELKRYYPTYSKGVRPVIQVTKDAAELSFEEPETKMIDEIKFAPVAPASIQYEDFYFRSSILESEESIKYSFNYSDDWVFSDKEQDRYNLMKTSICVALAAQGALDENGNGYGPQNIKSMMDSMGYNYVDSFSEGTDNTTDYGDTIVYPKPSVTNYDTIGSAIGIKNLKMPDGSKKSIILVAIRGGGYGTEWGGNFHVGASGKDSRGFRLAADQVGKRLKDFINNNRSSIYDDLHIWITGYSRAAATSNLVAADLINGTRPIEGVNSDNVMAFCFECPKTTTDKKAQDSMYRNIINIVNPNDFVPKVPLITNWGFDRYGYTSYIPCRESRVLYKTRYKQKMISEYVRIFAKNDISFDSDVVDEAFGQAVLLDGFFVKLGVFISRNDYYEKCEDSLVKIIGNYLGKAGGLDLEFAGPAIVDLLGGVCPFFVQTLSVGALFKSGGKHPPGKNSHYPELCLSWINSLSGFDKYSGSQNSKYRSYLINCPVNAIVRDSEGNIVGSIENDEVEEISDGIVAMIDENGQKVFVLPQEEEYTIEITATEDGEVNCTVEEHNFDSDTTEKVINYKKIEVSAGAELLATATELSEEEEAEYTLKYTENETEITPDEILTGEEIAEYVVEVMSNGNGSVIGGGSCITGEFTKVTAIPDKGYRFDGWYIDGECVSTESEYRFAVEKDTSIVAEFSKASISFKGKTTRGDMFNLANNVKVTWKEVPGAKYYKVYREGITEPKESQVEPVIVTERLIGWDKQPGLTNGHAYRYRIVASLTGKGDSSGDSPLSYSKIMYRLKTVVIRSVKNTASGKVTVKYDKTTSGDSYVLQYCEREDMVGAKTKVVLGADNTSYTIGGLKKGKTYYISIRVRKKVNGIDYYTTFGVPKKITVTK